MICSRWGRNLQLSPDSVKVFAMMIYVRSHLFFFFFSLSLSLLLGGREALPSDLRSMLPLYPDVQRGRGNVPDRWNLMPARPHTHTHTHTHIPTHTLHSHVNKCMACRNTQSAFSLNLLQVVRCGTHYASRRQGQRGDSGWDWVSKWKFSKSNEDCHFLTMCNLLLLPCPFFLLSLYLTAQTPVRGLHLSTRLIHRLSQ